MIFVCENNRWAVGVPASYALSVEDVSVRAMSYNVPGVTVDGTDVLAVNEAMAQAVQRAREGLGPSLIECKTYRWRGHAEQEGDPPDPRPQNEQDFGPANDPIDKFSNRLKEQGLASDSELAQMNQEVTTAVAEAIAFAKASPMPNPEDALTDVFAP